MARVQFAGGVEEIRGSIVGNTFSKNTSGNIIRSRKVPTQKYSSFQSNVLALTNTIQNLWRQQDETTVQDWNAFAAAHDRVNMFGKTTHLSGAQWFVNIQSNRNALGLAFDTNVPTYSAVPTPSGIFLLGDNTSLSVTGLVESFFDDYALVVFLSPLRQFSTGIYTRDIYRVIVLQVYSAASVDITTEYNAALQASFPYAVASRFSICGRVYAIEKSSGINSAGLSVSMFYPAP